MMGSSTKLDRMTICRRHILVLVTLVSSRHGLGSETSGHSGDGFLDTPTYSKCEPVTVPLCSEIPYNTTLYPNLLGHENQNEAGLEVQQFLPLVRVDCSRHLMMFLCSVYVPVCTIMEEPLPPCRRLCQLSRSGCEPIMNRFGFDWPEALDCVKFPEGGLCVEAAPDAEENEHMPTLSPNISYTVSIPELQGPWNNNNTWYGQPRGNANNVTYTDPPDECQPIDTPLCSSILPYNNTEMPNIFNHIDQWEATLVVHEWRPLFKSDCSGYLQYLLCRALFPPCWDREEADNIPTELPCRSMCHVVQDRCSHVMGTLNFDWPEEMSCEMFPVLGCNETINSVEGIYRIPDFTTTALEDQSTFSPVTSANPDSCRRLTNVDCRGFISERSRLPNVFGHTSQGQIETAVTKFKPLFTAGCQPDIRETICTSLFPPCDVVPIETVVSFCELVVNKCASFLEMGGRMPKNDMCHFVHISSSGVSFHGNTVNALFILFVLIGYAKV